MAVAEVGDEGGPVGVLGCQQVKVLVDNTEPPVLREVFVPPRSPVGGRVGRPRAPAVADAGGLLGAHHLVDIFDHDRHVGRRPVSAGKERRALGRVGDQDLRGGRAAKGEGTGKKWYPGRQLGVLQDKARVDVVRTHLRWPHSSPSAMNSASSVTLAALRSTRKTERFVAAAARTERPRRKSGILRRTAASW